VENGQERQPIILRKGVSMLKEQPEEKDDE
jgi:hypothetical protein